MRLQQSYAQAIMRRRLSCLTLKSHTLQTHSPIPPASQEPLLKGRPCEFTRDVVGPFTLLSHENAPTLCDGPEQGILSEACGTERCYTDCTLRKISGLTRDLRTCQVCPTQGAVLQARAAAGAVRLRHALAGAGCSLASTQATERVSTPPPHVSLQGDHAPT